MLKKQIKTGVVAGLAVGFGTVVSNLLMHYYWNSVRTPELNAELIKMCSEINKNCPIVLDKFTRIDTTVAGDRELYYMYTVMGMTDEDAMKLKDDLKIHTTEQARSNSETKKLLDRGIILKYTYSNMQGKVLFEYNVVK
jgi:hypothetical protein